MEINKGIDEKIIVKPVYVNLEHGSAYEGPCRLGIGDQLTNDYDKKSGAEKFKAYKQAMSKYPDFVETINPEYLYWTDDFIFHNDNFEKIAVRSITPEQKEEAREKTEELLDGAKANTMTTENIQKSVELYVVVKSLLEKYECNAFTMPCHEVCATRVFNDEFHFTPCLCHSLLKEEGIPSACELDLSALMSIAMLMNLVGNAPMMGNTGPFFVPDQLDFSIPSGLPVVPEIVGKENICFTFHAVQTRKMRGIDEPSQPYGLQSFTYSGWGATIRHDFNDEIGETITLLRFSPDARRMLAVKGEIVAASGMEDIGCATGLYWKCADSRDFAHKQQDFGHHFAWAYGDWIQDLAELGELLGVEVVTA